MSLFRVYVDSSMTTTATANTEVVYILFHVYLYGTLSSGFEIFTEVQDINAFAVRYHTTPDGTRLTVLQNGTEMYAYVYLENSFVTLHITQLDGLSETEIDAIPDMVDYRTIR